MAKDDKMMRLCLHEFSGFAFYLTNLVQTLRSINNMETHTATARDKTDYHASFVSHLQNAREKPIDFQILSKK